MVSLEELPPTAVQAGTAVAADWQRLMLSVSKIMRTWRLMTVNDMLSVFRTLPPVMSLQIIGLVTPLFTMKATFILLVYPKSDI